MVKFVVLVVYGFVTMPRGLFVFLLFSLCCSGNDKVPKRRADPSPLSGAYSEERQVISLLH